MGYNSYTYTKRILMSGIKNYYYEEFIEPSYEDSGIEEYELYLIFKKLKENLKTEEEVLEFFKPLWEEK